ncbi:outer membrane lipoprotein-sorting protein [Photobacterium lutimaris]|uniref:Uncharacterized protein TP-0789 domain-containing protein n=1 Tax=Photobacterium lutimaris TaxID=388278 RepID=A0A2T3IWI8_9GAMM|nr:outer membrane lipoprotein-sorting protein [Photobacterium lutimaris]PSU32787.1 hypothetical protein C9I99_17235 [Photobacterium lutimaris]TDR74402.1 MucB/RseB-like sigma(E) regulatory protein [Photobacterium lutimaris]
MNKAIMAVMFSVFAAASQAADPSTLMENVKWREDGVSRTASVTLLLTDARGNERQREVAFIERDRDNVRETRLLIQQPLDVKGTAILLKSDAEKASSEDDIWLYLPALKKVKRLSATNKRGRFVGSEFSYTDLEWLRVEDFSYQLLGAETWQGDTVYKIEALPASQEVIKKTGYSKKVLWVNPNYDMVVKAVYFDERERELKTMQVDEVSQLQGYWTAVVQTIHNLQSGRTTKMVVNDIEYDTTIPAKHFKQQNLKRAL